MINLLIKFIFFILSSITMIYEANNQNIASNNNNEHYQKLALSINEFQTDILGKPYQVTIERSSYFNRVDYQQYNVTNEGIYQERHTEDLGRVILDQKDYYPTNNEPGLKYSIMNEDAVSITENNPALTLPDFNLFPQVDDKFVHQTEGNLHSVSCATRNLDLIESNIISDTLTLFSFSTAVSTSSTTNFTFERVENTLTIKMSTYSSFGLFVEAIFTWEYNVDFSFALEDFHQAFANCPLTVLKTMELDHTYKVPAITQSGKANYFKLDKTYDQLMLRSNVELNPSTTLQLVNQNNQNLEVLFMYFPFDPYSVSFNLPSTEDEIYLKIDYTGRLISHLILTAQYGIGYQDITPTTDQAFDVLIDDNQRFAGKKITTLSGPRYYYFEFSEFDNRRYITFSKANNLTLTNGVLSGYVYVTTDEFFTAFINTSCRVVVRECFDDANISSYSSPIPLKEFFDETFMVSPTYGVDYFTFTVDEGIGNLSFSKAVTFSVKNAATGNYVYQNNYQPGVYIVMVTASVYQPYQIKAVVYHDEIITIDSNYYNHNGPFLSTYDYEYSFSLSVKSRVRLDNIYGGYELYEDTTPHKLIVSNNPKFVITLMPGNYVMRFFYSQMDWISFTYTNYGPTNVRAYNDPTYITLPATLTLEFSDPDEIFKFDFENQTGHNFNYTILDGTVDGHYTTEGNYVMQVNELVSGNVYFIHYGGDQYEDVLCFLFRRGTTDTVTIRVD